MPGTISVEHRQSNYESLGYIVASMGYLSIAISHEGRVVSEALSIVKDRSASSETLSGYKQEAVRSLRALNAQCADNNWDGDGAERIQGITQRIAENLIRALPYGVEMPEISAGSDGSISFDWIPERGRMLSLEVGLDSRLPFAWVNRGDRGHGVADFDENSMPANLIDKLLLIFQR